MRLLFFCGIILTLAAIAANGQSSGDQEREAICKKVVCREVTTVKLKVSDKEYAEFEFPRGPYVAEGFINVLSGEHFSVEFDEQDGKLLNPRFVKETVHPERTVAVGLSQNESQMVFAVSNPFSRTIVYDCMIQHYQQQSLSRTSVAPVSARSQNFEGWPFPISQIVISNVHFQPSSYGIGPGHIQPDPKARVLSKPPPEIAEEDCPKSQITIVLRAIFTSDAMVTKVRFFKVTPEDAPKEMVTLLTDRAIAAAKRIKFVPAVKDGRSVSMYVQLEYNFGPPKEEPKPAEKTPAAEPSKPKNEKPGI